MNLRAHILNSAPLNPEFPDSTVHIPPSAFRAPRLSRAFTLIELLVVIAIIGILMAVGLPAMRGMTRSNAMIAANRQFLDDLTYARQRAIGDHTSVYVVFVPTNITQMALPTNPSLKRQITNLYTGQYTTYALLSLRQLGDQPGVSVPKYLTGWRTLPNGVFIATAKFATPPPPGGTGFFRGNLPFPVATNSASLLVPFIEFNYLGQLASPIPFIAAQDQYIPLARGSIFFDPVTAAADVQENPTGNSTGSTSNVVYINALTGRAKIAQQSIQ